MSRVRSLLIVAIGLLLGSALVAAVQAQPPGGGLSGLAMGGHGSIRGLLKMEQVQKALKLNEEQLAKVNQLNEEARAEVAAARDIKDSKMRMAKMIQLSRRHEERALKQIRSILRQDQMKRLHQIEMQVRPAADSLNGESLAGRLGLTDAQKEELAQLNSDMQDKQAEVATSIRDPGQAKEIFKKFHQLRNDANKRALGLLTAEQKKSFEQMQGEKIELEVRLGRP